MIDSSFRHEGVVVSGPSAALLPGSQDRVVGGGKQNRNRQGEKILPFLPPTSNLFFILKGLFGMSGWGGVSYSRVRDPGGGSCPPTSPFPNETSASRSGTRDLAV